MKKFENNSAVLNLIRSDFIGLDTKYILANGEKTQRIYLDSTASTLMMGAAHDAVEEFYKHYANTHSLLHFSARIATREYQHAHQRILSFLNADPDTYACFFTGSGATAGINRLARTFRDYHTDRNIALVSLMEHHSNDLPHRKHAKKVIHIPLNDHNGNPGCIDIDILEQELKNNQGQVNYVAMTGVSNVTGIINPIYDIAELAHNYGALIMVDGAQMAAHMPVKVGGHKNPRRNLDAFVFSGHKTYVPGSPGVVICRKDILQSMEPEEVGGGMVDRVNVDYYTILTSFPDREEAGTPNIPGAIGLAAAIEVLDRIGMETIYEDETELINFALEQIKNISDVVLYGEPDNKICPRAASISFNIKGMDHGLTAAVLNDYFNIAVRNACFCAHPYVRNMIAGSPVNPTSSLKEDEYDSVFRVKTGMVRASFGIYSSVQDIEALVTALREIVADKDHYISHYKIDLNGNYVHKTFRPDVDHEFFVTNFIDQYLSE
jgi:selenocysteine lyase/cysteine desulfurase